MSPWTLIVLGYAGFYAILAYAIHNSNLAVGYPAPYVLFSAVAQLLLIAGIVLFAFGPSFDTARRWRWLFPFLVLDVCIGVALDATVPTDFSLRTHGSAWIANLLLNLWLVAPAYYFNFKVARYGSGS